MASKRKYIRDAKGRFAEVPGSHPQGLFAHQFSPPDQAALTKQLKSDRAKTRREKAKLLAAAGQGNPPEAKQQDNGPSPEAKAAAKAMWTKTPITGKLTGATIGGKDYDFTATKSEKKTEVELATDELLAAKASGDANAAKKARAKLRRAKAKAEASSHGQNVTFADEQKPAAPPVPKAKKAGPSQREQVLQKAVIRAGQESTAASVKIKSIQDQIDKLKNTYNYEGGYSAKYKAIEALADQQDAEKAKKAKAEADKAQARQELTAARAQRMGKVSSPTDELKSQITAFNVREKSLLARTKELEVQAAELQKKRKPYPDPNEEIYNKQNQVYEEMGKIRQEINQIKKDRAEVRAKLDRATGKLDLSADPNDVSWSTTRKMNTSISAMNTKYEQEDAPFRKKLKSFPGSYADELAEAANPTPKLPEDVRKAHQDYTHATYRYINNHLRGEKVSVHDHHLLEAYWAKRGGMPKLVESVSSLINDHGHTTEEPVTVMRGIRGNATYHPAEIYKEGAIVEEKAFTSVTVSKKIQASFAKPRGFKGDNSSWSMYVRLPAGTNYAHGNLVEREMILDKGTKFKVQKVDHVKNEIYLMKVD